jgi:hypothetical protein
MKFHINLAGKTLYNVMRQAGYAPAFTRSGSLRRSDGEQQESVFYRALTGGDFPKFHIYATSNNGTATLNLHLDQKKPSYRGTSAHGGEYDGTLIETEASRIKQVSDP